VKKVGILGLAFALAATSLAHADVVPVVSVKSPIDHLSKKDLADIFLGRTARLPDGEQIRKVLATNPHAVAYLDRSQLDGTVKAVRIE
jgi:ABC-type phosphate transport system substrate-binding protein